MLTSQNHRTPESIHEAAIKFKTSTPINVNTLKPVLGTEHFETAPPPLFIGKNGRACRL